MKMTPWTCCILLASATLASAADPREPAERPDPRGDLSGLTDLTGSVNGELSDIARALRGLDQSFSIRGFQGCGAATAGSVFIDWRARGIDPKCAPRVLPPPPIVLGTPKRSRCCAGCGELRLDCVCEHADARALPHPTDPILIPRRAPCVHPDCQPVPGSVPGPAVEAGPALAPAPGALVPEPEPELDGQAGLRTDAALHDSEGAFDFFTFRPGFPVVWQFERTETTNLRGDGLLDLSRDSVAVVGIDEALVRAATESDQWTIAAVLDVAEPTARPVSLISCGAGRDTNFALILAGRTLELQIQTTSADGPAVRSVPLGQLAAGRTHLVVSYKSGRLACYRDGRPAEILRDVSGDLSGWTPQPLRIGGSPVAAAIGGIEIVPHFVGAASVRDMVRRTAE